MEVQAAIGLHQLRKLEEFNRARIRNARFLSRRLSKLEGIRPPYVREGVRHVFHQYTVLLELEGLRCDRDEFVKALRAENIDARVYYPVPIHKQPAYRDLCKGLKLPVTEEVASRVLSLPVHPALTEEDLKAIVLAVEKVLGHFQKK